MENLKLIIDKEERLFYVDARFDVSPSATSGEQVSFMTDSYKDITVLDDFILRFGSIKKRIYGFEVSWKSKKPHCHIRYCIVHNGVKIPSTFGSAFTYYYKKLKLTPLPKGGHMVKMIDKPNNIDAFFQYCLKDQEDFSDLEIPLIKGFSLEYLHMLYHKARENRRIAKQLFDKEEKKKNNEVLEYGKLTDYLDKNVNQHIFKEYQLKGEDTDIYNGGSYHGLLKHLGTLIIQFYIINHDCKTPTSNKLLSTIHRYCLQKEIMTAQDICIILLKL